MLQRSLKLIVVLLILIIGNKSVAQNFDQHSASKLKSQGKIYPENAVASSNSVDKLCVNLQDFYPLPIASIAEMPASKPIPAFQLPGQFYTKCLGFFCRQELKIDQTSPVLFRFRLGSVDYVNWMEQKPNAMLKN